MFLMAVLLYRTFVLRTQEGRGVETAGMHGHMAGGCTNSNARKGTVCLGAPHPTSQSAADGWQDQPPCLPAASSDPNTAQLNSMQHNTAPTPLAFTTREVRR